MTMVVVMCIPFSLIVACGAIWAMGKTMNTLTLLGLIVGIGMLVDNAVVVMENIYRHQQSGLGRAQAAKIGAREVSTAVIAATITSVIVFLPMIFNKPSEMNIYLRELAITVCLALLVVVPVPGVTIEPEALSLRLGEVLPRYMQPAFIDVVDSDALPRTATHKIRKAALLDALDLERDVMIVTADHGNAEQMVDPKTGGPQTAHTTNPVPCILVDKHYKGELITDGSLRDIAPTICNYLGITPPEEMTGRDLRTGV